MRIVSPFKDYYDSAMALGHDAAVTFVRNETSMLYPVPTEESARALNCLVPEPSCIFETRSPFGADSPVKLCPVSIAFCGKTYNGIRVLELGSAEHPVFYDKPSLVAYLEKRKLFSILGNLEPRRSNRWGRYQGASKLLSQQGNTAHSAFLHAYRIAIMVWTPEPYNSPILSKNAKLADFQFFKVMDAYSAYQELDMYLSGILAENEQSMLTVADSVKVQQHGFDKYSFRKSPTKDRSSNRSAKKTP
jgi:hypothetical protein